MPKSEPSARITRCPTCGKSSRFDQTNPDRPFCSPRCKTHDIAGWADEAFRIPSQQTLGSELDEESEIERTRTRKHEQQED